jgi:hypothetical protein
LPETSEPVGKLPTSAAFVGELGDERGEGLGVARNPQRPGVHRIETDIANQPRRELMAEQKSRYERVLQYARRSPALK